MISYWHYNVVCLVYDAVLNAIVSEQVIGKCAARNTTIQLSTPYIDPELSNSYSTPIISNAV